MKCEIIIVHASVSDSENAPLAHPSNQDPVDEVGPAFVFKFLPKIKMHTLQQRQQQHQQQQLLHQQPIVNVKIQLFTKIRLCLFFKSYETLPQNFKQLYHFNTLPRMYQ